MPDTRPTDGTPQPLRRSSVVPLAVSSSATPAVTDHIPTVIGENPLAPSQPTAFDLPPGSTLGHFEVIGPLGVGGMATVFRAKDTTLGREVALKILPPTLATDPDAVARFKFEARAAAKLNHDHVARVFYIGEDRGLHFIAFEFVDGQTLREVIDAGGPVAPSVAVRYLLDTAVGLRHAAERGVVHRDVKPSNIVITPAGRAKLIDMGLARSADPHSVNGGVTQSGMTLGTFDYISPEQAIDPRRADVRADIYSLGCTFYHALTGQPPVPEGNAARKLAAHQGESPTDPRLINPEVPDSLAAVLDRMMAKNPDHRYQTAGELIAQLGLVARELGVADVGSEPLAEGAPSAAPPVTNRTLLTVFSLVIGGLAVVFAAVLVLTAGGTGRSAAPEVPWSDPPPRPSAPSDVLPSDPLPVRIAPTTKTVGNRDELLQALKDGVAKVTLAAGVYDLSDTEGVVISGRACELDGSPDGVTLRVAAAPRAEKTAEPRPGTLTFLKCESVKLTGIKVEVAHAGDGPRSLGLLFQEVAVVDIAECRFVLLPTSAADGALIAFARTGVVNVKHGFFVSKGWAGVELTGGVKAEFGDSGFVTSRAGVEVVPSAEATVATLTATHATFMLNGTASAAVSVAKGGRCDFTAGHSLFAAPAPAEPGMMTDSERKPKVLSAGDPTDAVTFAAQPGHPNAVYRVEPPATGTTPELLTVSPWAGVKDAADPFAALELKTDLPLVRVGEGGRGILGATHLREGKSLYPDWPLRALVEAGVVIWQPDLDPTQKEKGLVPANVFADLRSAVAAVAAVKGTGVLRIRGKGRFEVPPQVLNEPKLRLTVRPEKEGTVVLVPAASIDPRPTTLFRLEAGELVLDGLQFAVKPGEKADTAAVVAVAGGKRCEFRKCLFTLSENDAADERTAVVSLADVSEQMGDKGKDKFGGRPAVVLSDCLVRGRGRVVRAGGAIPADVSLTNVGIATDDVPAFEFGPPARTAGPLAVQLTSVTAVLGGPLVDVRGARRPLDDKSPSLVKLEVQADNCLFVSLDTSTRPLFKVTTLDPTSADRPLTWGTTRGNAFGGWVTYAELTLDDTDPKTWDRADWRRWSGETPSVGGLLKTPKADSLPAVRPADLEPTPETTTGAQPKSLPQPIDG